MSGLEWVCKSFDELSGQEIYAVMKLRSEVFVVEQNCVYLDADNKDLKCYHLIGCINNEIAAYARLLPAGISYEKFVSIGRVVSSPHFRSVGAGKELMLKAVAGCKNVFGEIPIKIGAQLYLENFYEGFGFIRSSNEYDEDGIPHIEMLRL